MFQICGHGVASDLVLTGRPMQADEAYAHGIVSRVVPAEELDAGIDRRRIRDLDDGDRRPRAGERCVLHVDCLAEFR